MKSRIFLLILEATAVFMYSYRKPIPQTLWRQNCAKNSQLLNDCNWCKCENNKYSCKARVCNEVDMFKHFNEAINDINVGMEGHGVWRSGNVECQPGVQYKRDELLCVCGKNGKWPSLICKKTFLLLDSVDTALEEEPDDQECVPETIRMFGCRMCFCGSSGRINATNCYDDLCAKDYGRNGDDSKDVIKEFYAECILGKVYSIGLNTCQCLRNNRLVCNQRNERSLCKNRRSGESFYVDCNQCYCDDINQMHCTAKRCLSALSEESLKERFRMPTGEFPFTETPIDDTECIPGTQYINDCNTCKCFNDRNMKVHSCTVKKCSENDFGTDCVEGTTYEKNCHHCYCTVIDGVKQEICGIDDHCTRSDQIRKTDLAVLHGYCEPQHVYKKDCNVCKCQSNGQIMTCTTRVCNSLSVDLVPIAHELGRCRAGHTYRIDCNVCYCLSNGNILCTMAVCNGK
ncbi:uncharacterized protein LOC101743262 [Bombyx mori]|uniref:Pacifastin domain-containing protein n=1 Tax=Bombyx mori TaxID=7091 RepID=A0A8R2HQI6_BOMMO|nr:uncharacterized protein LOC101743262 [Bombyx mori]